MIETVSFTGHSRERGPLALLLIIDWVVVVDNNETEEMIVRSMLPRKGALLDFPMRPLKHHLKRARREFTDNLSIVLLSPNNPPSI